MHQTTSFNERIESVGYKVPPLFVGDAVEEDEESDRMALLAVLEGSRDAIITADEEGNIKSWNKAAVAMFGFVAGH